MFGAWTSWLDAMAAGPVPSLEVRHPAVPVNRRRSPSVILVHGAYAAAWCWQVHWLDHLAAAGVPARALSLRGHGDSGGHLDTAGIAAYVADVESVIARTGEPCVLVGHSMGGFVVQRLIERGHHEIAAAALLAPVPPTGLLGSGLRLMGRDPMLAGQLSMLQGAGPALVDIDVARRALFSPRVPDAVVERFAPLMQRESPRALWEMTFGPLPSAAALRRAAVPTLLVAAAEDALFAPQELRSAAQQIGADYELAARVGHGMMLEPHWQPVADAVLHWLGASGVYQR